MRSDFQHNRFRYVSFLLQNNLGFDKNIYIPKT